MTKPKLRCAIYTRKSSEEGLEQDFNSLDAQREACEAYITSQAGEGWTLVRTHFDDGGYSGGNMERPGLKELLTAIDAGRIDVVVVYKVDRLTRSLSDFARIIEQFDAKKVSFVSVTQAFNTTTSMGRLTLNVLLSFAQFEREVTGERIRDKMAASKKKGLWMGGAVPLGYDPAGRTLKINDKEAETVRWIFKRYTELKSVEDVGAELVKRGIKSKTRINAAGKKVGGFTIMSGALRHMLVNPIYLGQIRHKDKIYPGLHKAIITQALWDKVQATLEENRYDRKAERVRAHEEWWLTGKLFDASGRPMTPTFTTRESGARYKYYFVKEGAQDSNKSAVTRIRMDIIHEIVSAAILDRFRKLNKKATGTPASLVSKVVIENRIVRIEASISSSRQHSSTHNDRRQQSTKTVRIEVPIRIAKRGQRSEIIPPQELGLRRIDQKIVDALRLAWQWRQEIENGTHATPELLAEAKGVSKRYVNKLLPLGFLPRDEAVQLICR